MDLQVSQIVKSPLDCIFRGAHGGSKGVETWCKLPVEEKPKDCSDYENFPAKCPLRRPIPIVFNADTGEIFRGAAAKEIMKQKQQPDIKGQMALFGKE